MADFIWGFGGEPLSQDQIAEQQRLADSLSQNQQPVNSWAQGASNVINALLGGFERGSAAKESENNERYSEGLIKGLMGSAGQSGSVPALADTAPSPGQQIATNLAQPSPQNNSQPLTVGQAAGQGAKDLITQHFVDQMRQVESGGNNNAKNPLSSATGPFQFTNGTWNGLMQQHPELGLTADGRTDPQQSEAAAKQLASDNIAYLLSKGVQNPTDGQAYLAHFAGAPTAANLIQASPNTPVSSIMSPQQIAANPFLRGMTAGGVQNWANTQMGATASAPPQQQAAQLPAQQTPPYQLPAGPSMGAVLNVLADPRANQQAKGIAGAILQNQLQLQQVAQRYQMEQADPENVARRRYYDAETQRITNQPQQQQGFTPISPDQAQNLKLDPTKSYQQGPDGKIYEIGSNGTGAANNAPSVLTPDQVKAAGLDPNKTWAIGHDGVPKAVGDSPAALAQKQDATQKGSQLAVQSLTDAANSALQIIDQHPSSTTGNIGHYTASWFPGSNAAQLRNYVETIKANGSYATMAQLKSQGVSLGQMSDADMRLAAAKAGAINPDAPPATLRKQINDYVTFVKGAYGGNGSATPSTPEASSGQRTTSNGVSWSVR